MLRLKEIPHYPGTSSTSDDFEEIRIRSKASEHPQNRQRDILSGIRTEFAAAGQRGRSEDRVICCYRSIYVTSVKQAASAAVIIML